MFEKISKYIKNNLFRLRQLIAVVCLLITLIIVANIKEFTYGENIKKEENKAISGSTLVLSKSTNNKESHIPTSGVSSTMENILKEGLEKAEKEPCVKKQKKVKQKETVKKEPIKEIQEEPERENKLYYIVDNGEEYYLDEKYQDYIWKKLKEYNRTDLYELVIALIYHESNFKEKIVSPTNDYGFMQINIHNLTWLRETLKIESLYNGYDNIDCGIYILVTNAKRYNTIEEALVAYNQGYVRSVKSTEYSRCILYHDMNCLREL